LTYLYFVANPIMHEYDKSIKQNGTICKLLKSNIYVKMFFAKIVMTMAALALLLLELGNNERNSQVCGHEAVLLNQGH